MNKDPNLSNQGRDFDVYSDPDDFPWAARRAMLAIGVVTFVVLLVTFGPAVVEWLR